jgi:hypothetical protein
MITKIGSTEQITAQDWFRWSIRISDGYWVTKGNKEESIFD